MPRMPGFGLELGSCDTDVVYGDLNFVTVGNHDPRSCVYFGGGPCDYSCRSLFSTWILLGERVTDARESDHRFLLSPYRTHYLLSLYVSTILSPWSDLSDPLEVRITSPSGMWVFLLLVYMTSCFPASLSDSLQQQRHKHPRTNGGTQKHRK